MVGGWLFFGQTLAFTFSMCLYTDCRYENAIHPLPNHASTFRRIPSVSRFSEELIAGHCYECALMTNVFLLQESLHGCGASRVKLTVRSGLKALLLF